MPIALQAKLLVKVYPYDRSMKKRAKGGPVRIAIVYRKGDADSEKVAYGFKQALSKVDRIGKLPHKETLVPWTGANDLVDLIEERQISIVYLAPALRSSAGRLSKRLVGTNVLTVASLARYVKRGAVLGFDVVSGKPKLLLNLPQAKLQKVRFSTRVLKLMEVLR